jgi:hypothetical protein
VSTDAASFFDSASVGFLSPDSTFEARVATFDEVFSFLPIRLHSPLLDDGQGTCERRCRMNTTVADVRRGLTGGSAATLNLPRITVLRRHLYGGMVASLYQTTVGGLPRVTISGGAVSKAQPVTHHVARRSATERLVSKRRQPLCLATFAPSSREVKPLIPVGPCQPISLSLSLYLTSRDRSFNDMGVAMADEAKEERKAPTTQPKQRSPEHPAIGLQEAIQRAEEFYKHESFNYAPVDIAKRHFGYGPKSSSGMRLVAALIHFGLFEETGGGHERRVRLTPLARNILLDKREDPTEREAAVRTAALTPLIYRKLWKHWNGNLPSDANMEFELIRRFKFNPDSVRAFIKDFRATIAYAKLAQLDKIEDATDEGEEELMPVVNPLVNPLGLGLTPRKSAPPNPNRGAQMPAYQSNPSELPPIDLPMPLAGGRRAILRMPAVISEAEYDLILKLIRINMEAMKETIVAKPTQSPGDGD